MRIDRSFVLLDASQSVREALSLVRQDSRTRHVIVRREQSGNVYWYSYRAARFLAHLTSQTPGDTLEKALDLHEHQSVPRHVEGSSDSLTQVHGAVVVNARSRLVGVLEDEMLGGGRPPMKNAVEPPAPPSRPRSIGFRGEKDDEGASSGASGAGQGTGVGMPSGGRPRNGGERRSLPESVPAPPPATRSGGRRSAPKSAPAAPPASGGGGVRRSAIRVPPPPAAAPAPVSESAESVAPRERAGIRHEPTTSRAPFAAWPDLVAPEAVEEHEAFTLEIGFAREKQRGVSGGPVVLIDAPEEFDLRVQVVAVGFDAPDGWVHDLHVVRADPYTSRLKVKLVAQAGDQAAETRTLAVQFYHRSNLCGQAQRSIVVKQRGAAAGVVAAAVGKAPEPSGVAIRVTSDMPAPDLTVTVRLGTGRGLREAFHWSFESPHAITIPEGTAVIELDQNAGAYVDSILQQLLELSDGPTADNEMKGIGKEIESRVPPAFWIALEETARAVAPGRVPDVLFVTEETRLPWELAWMRKPLDPTRPGHLGAQVNFGRWILGAQRPPLPPEHQVPWSHMAIVIGNYAEGSGMELPDAVAEAKALAQRYGDCTTSIELSGEDLDPFLEGKVPTQGAQVVHFACHGKSKSGDAAVSALVMHDARPFTPRTLRGSGLGEQWMPFLFLNACEVGAAGVALGQTAGFAGAALSEGFRGFVGPLWEVESTVAREIAEEFYRLTLDEDKTVAEALREMRSKYRYGGANATPSPDTYLAYVYYGHPGLRLKRQT